jgi:hypothetical protein
VVHQAWKALAQVTVAVADEGRPRGGKAPLLAEHVQVDAEVDGETPIEVLAKEDLCRAGGSKRPI